MEKDGDRCSLQKKRVLLGYPQLAVLVVVCMLVGHSVPAEFRVLREEEWSTAKATNREISGNFLGRSRLFSGHQDNNTSAPDQLQLVWLMSFPNSGTSYTSRLVRSSTLTRTAVNYGTEFRNDSVPVFPADPSGPFWVLGDSREFSLPERFVLTKTHCGCHCMDCSPRKYTETTFSFRHRCESGRRLTFVNGSRVVENVSYSATKVAKVVHLIRNPFDNIVSRYHLERKSGRAAEFPASKEGFREYCKGLNTAYLGDEKTSLALDDALLEQMQDFPCRADLIRYVEWHNMAFLTSRDLNLDTYVVYYDWYTTRFNETTTALLDFLELEAKAEPQPFVTGKVYRDYFTEAERAVAKHAVEFMASRETWNHVSRYFTPDERHAPQ